MDRFLFFRFRTTEFFYHDSFRSIWLTNTRQGEEETHRSLVTSLIASVGTESIHTLIQSTIPMAAPRSPSSIPRQSSLQQALSELDIKRMSSSDDENSLRSSTASCSDKKSSLKKELCKLKADRFFEQYERVAAQRGMTRL